MSTCRRTVPFKNFGDSTIILLGLMSWYNLFFKNEQDVMHLMLIIPCLHMVHICVIVPKLNGGQLKTIYFE